MHDLTNYKPIINTMRETNEKQKCNFYAKTPVIEKLFHLRIVCLI